MNNSNITYPKFVSPGLTNSSKTLFANIGFSSLDKNIQVISIVSAIRDEGKTVVSLNLASSIAMSGYSVLLIDADMRKRSIGNHIGLHGKYGIYSIVSESRSFEDVVVKTELDNLYFLDCENNIVSPPDIISSDKFSSILKDLRKQFDYIIFDTPPILSFIDASLLGNLVDGVIYVVRENKTKQSSIRDALKQLEIAHTNIIGSVLTFSSDNSSDYYYAYYDKDDKRIRKSY